MPQTPSRTNRETKTKAAADSKNPAQVVKEITSGAAPPGIVLITAPDEIRRERIASIIIEAFIKSKGGSASDILRRDASSLKLSDVDALIQEFSSISLFIPNQWCIIRNIEKCSDSVLERLAILSKNIAQGSCVLLLGSKLAASHSLSKICKGLKSIVTLEQLKGMELRRWTQREFKNAGLNPPSQLVLESVLSIGEESPDTIASIVERISLYVEGGDVQPHDLSSLFVHHTDPGEFKLVDCIAARQVGPAEVLVTQLLRNGKSPFLLLSLLFRTHINYLAVKNLLDQKLSVQEIRERLGMTPWLFQKYVHVAERSSIPGLRKKIHALLRADSQLKNRSLGPEAICSELVSKLAA